MRRFVYLREFGTKDGINFGNLTLQQRLFMSAVLTRARYDDPRTLAEIIFNYDNLWASSANFRDYDELITSVIDDQLGTMCDYITKHAKDLDEDRKSNGAEQRYSIKACTIDLSKVYLLRNGNGHSLPQIAWKAFALAAAVSTMPVTSWRALGIYNWCTDIVCQQKAMATNKTILKRNIEKWLRLANVSGEFIGDAFLVDSKKYQKNGEPSIRGCSKAAKK